MSPITSRACETNSRHVSRQAEILKNNIRSLRPLKNQPYKYLIHLIELQTHKLRVCDAPEDPALRGTFTAIFNDASFASRGQICHSRACLGGARTQRRVERSRRRHILRYKYLKVLRLRGVDEVYYGRRAVDLHLGLVEAGQQTIGGPEAGGGALARK